MNAKDLAGLDLGGNPMDPVFDMAIGGPTSAKQLHDMLAAARPPGDPFAPASSYSQPNQAQQVRGLVASIGMSQRAIARELEINERTMRAYCSGSPVPKVILLALERLREMQRQVAPATFQTQVNMDPPRKVRLRVDSVEQSEVDDAIAHLTKRGHGEGTFLFERMRSTPLRQNGGPIIEDMQVTNTATGKSKTYEAGDGSIWPAQFCDDIDAGVFGSRPK